MRIAEHLRDLFDEERPLRLAGAMVLRTTADTGVEPTHVDQANIPYYDYSAVVYLSTEGAELGGGKFAFRDAHGDALVSPRAGRCLLFSSGYEHLHQVQAVTSGVRMAISMGFTLQQALPA